MGWIEGRIISEYHKHKRLRWAEIAEKKLIGTILDWCYKNNTIKVGHYKLATTDGGHINLLKLQSFLEGNRISESAETTDWQKCCTNCSKSKGNHYGTLGFCHEGNKDGSQDKFQESETTLISVSTGESK